jgi:hypothetical protein
MAVIHPPRSWPPPKPDYQEAASKHSFSKASPTKGDRTASNIKPTQFVDIYRDLVECERQPDGYFGCRIMPRGDTKNQNNGPYSESTQGSSQGSRSFTDGSWETYGANERKIGQGYTATLHEGSDSLIAGNEIKHNGTQGAQTCAGRYSDHNGEHHTYTSAITQHATAESIAFYSGGKTTINAEGGVGLGVNKGEARKVYMRMEPDGTFHIQVTPKGQEGGNAVVKIEPDGSVLVTSESTITVESKGTHTIRAPLLHVDAPITTTSTITSDGNHKAPLFVGPSVTDLDV